MIRVLGSCDGAIRVSSPAQIAPLNPNLKPKKRSKSGNFQPVSCYRKLFSICIIFLRVLLSSTQTPSVQHNSSTQAPHLFSTQNSSVQHQKPLSLTPKTPLFHAKNPSVQHLKPLSSTHPSDKKQLYISGVDLRDVMN